VRSIYLPWLLASVACLVSSPALAGVVVLFEHQNFEGKRMTLGHDMPNLDRTDFNDRTESILVRDGTWEVCTDARFRGHCVRLAPGEYRNLSGELTRSISSLREVRGGPPPGPQTPPADDRPRAVLYERQNFGGRQFVIEDQVIVNFEGSGFNDRASSLWVEGGYWLFCTDANFQGTCRTFGPGRYAQLPLEVNNKISSGRRIHEQYPYNAPPNWKR
jgi:Beta/Gamma crystallin